MLTIPGFGDHQVGMNLAAGVLAALYRARETGQGDRVIASLFHSAIWDVSLMLQSAQYGDPSTQFPLSRRSLPNPLTVAHKTKDNKWLQIAMPQYNRHYPIFMRAIGHDELAEDPRFYPQTNLQSNLDEFYDFLVAEMASRTLDEWCRLMDANDLQRDQLGKSKDFPLTDAQIQDAMADNPSGQGDELTPLILIRPVK